MALERLESRMMLTVIPSYVDLGDIDGVTVGSDAKPATADLDLDGDQDLVVGDASGNLSYFENAGIAIAPNFVERTGASSPLSSISVASQAAPAFADLDGDGDQDLIVGDGTGKLRYFRNDGTPVAAGFVEQTGTGNPFDGVDGGPFSSLGWRSVTEDPCLAYSPDILVKVQMVGIELLQVERLVRL